MTEEEALNAAAVQLYMQLFGSDNRAMADLRDYQQTADYANAFPGAPHHFQNPESNDDDNYTQLQRDADGAA